LPNFEFGSRDIVMNVTAFVKLHQHKRDNKTDRGPFQATQSKIKHPEAHSNRRIACLNLDHSQPGWGWRLRFRNERFNLGFAIFDKRRSTGSRRRFLLRKRKPSCSAAGALDAEFPPIAVGIVKPETHVR